jgi:6,7-dimethyl-8-ribityllumazine synthase
VKTEPNGAVPDAKGKRFALVIAQFYPEIAEMLEGGARRALHAANAAEIDSFTVPGCFELPIAAKRAIEIGDYDGIVALGVVVRGETPHFDYVAGECARGLMTIQIASGIPIGFGVLTTDTLAQAVERADPARGDKGYHAALAAAAMAVFKVEKKEAQSRVGFR